MVRGLSGDPLIYFVIGFGIGLYLLYSAAKKYLFLIKIRNTPTSKIRSVALGLTEVFGKALNKNDLKSPISKIPSAYWKIVAQYYHVGRNPGWKDFYENESESLFYIEDDTGKVLVDPKGAEIETNYDKLFEGYISGRGEFGMRHKKIAPEVRSYIKNLSGDDKEDFMDYKHLNVRIYESYIANGDPLYVLGTAEHQKGYPAKLSYENLVIKKGKYDKSLYITDSHEKNIQHNMKSSVILTFFGGLVLSIVCLLFILLHFKLL